jgi:hypothetical protein
LNPNYNFHFNGIKRNAFSNAIVNFISWTDYLPYNHNTFSSFHNLLAHIAISQSIPLDQCFVGLSKPFNCTNNFFIVMYHVMGWPWLSKWKIKVNWIIFFFFSTWFTPWLICCNIIIRALAKWNFSLATWMLFYKK